MSKVQKILFTALFIASTVVLRRILSIQTPIITIGFSFVPIMLAGIMLGWKECVFVSTISDIIGALLFPTGSFFFGFTVSAFLTGLVYGLILHREKFQVDKDLIIRLVISTFIVTALINGVLNTVWVMMITKNASSVVVPIRVLKQLVMMPIKIVTILGITKVFEERIKRLVND